VAYLERGVDCYVDFLDEVPSASQINKDSRALYGALLSACQSGVGRGSKSDPCLCKMWVEKVNHMIIIRIYVNDCLIIGKEECIDCLIDKLKED
jgi:hypothetical protein